MPPYKFGKINLPGVAGVYEYIGVTGVDATGLADKNWIALDGGPFSLTLRLYNPDASVAADPAGVALPVIKKVSCT